MSDLDLALSNFSVVVVNVYSYALIRAWFVRLKLKIKLQGISFQYSANQAAQVNRNTRADDDGCIKCIKQETLLQRNLE